MIRTRIQLTEEQARALKAQARTEERSMAEPVRERVAEYLMRRRFPTICWKPAGGFPSAWRKLPRDRCSGTIRR